MFSLVFSNSQSIVALDATQYLNDLYTNTKFKAEDVNFFEWQTYPDESRGRLLVAEDEFLAKYPSGASSLTANLVITDHSGVSITFSGVSITNVGVFASGLSGDNINKIVVLELNLNRTIGGVSCGSSLVSKFASWSSLTTSLFNIPGVNPLLAPLVFNYNLTYAGVPVEKVAAMLANMQGLVAFPSNSSIQKADLGVTPFNPDNVIHHGRIVHHENGITNKILSYDVRFLHSVYDRGEVIIHSGPPQTLNGPSSQSHDYNSLPGTGTNLNVRYLYPWDLYDPAALIGSPSIESYSKYYFDAVKERLLTRASHKFDIVVEGVNTSSLDLTLNHIRYYFNSSGMFTRLRSKDFKIEDHNFLDATNSLRIERFTLTSALAAYSSATATIISDDYRNGTTITVTDHCGKAAESGSAGIAYTLNEITYYVVEIFQEPEEAESSEAAVMFQLKTVPTYSTFNLIQDIVVSKIDISGVVESDITVRLIGRVRSKAGARGIAVKYGDTWVVSLLQQYSDTVEITFPGTISPSTASFNVTIGNRHGTFPWDLPPDEHYSGGFNVDNPFKLGGLFGLKGIVRYNSNTNRYYLAEVEKFATMIRGKLNTALLSSNSTTQIKSPIGMDGPIFSEHLNGSGRLVTHNHFKWNANVDAETISVFDWSSNSWRLIQVECS